MIQKSFIVVAALIYCTCVSFMAQAEDNLSKLLHERDQLYKAYEYHQSQNSSLFGKKSKKDLLNIINTLNEIIDKDSRIIREVRLKSNVARIQTTQKESGYVNQNHQTMERIAALNNEMDMLSAQVKLKQSELQTQRDMYEAQENAFTLVKCIAGIMAVTVVLLAWYIRRLRLSLSHK